MTIIASSKIRPFRYTNSNGNPREHLTPRARSSRCPRAGAPNGDCGRLLPPKNPKRAKNLNQTSAASKTANAAGTTQLIIRLRSCYTRFLFLQPRLILVSITAEG